jgi:hypothetical protein
MESATTSIGVWIKLWANKGFVHGVLVDVALPEGVMDAIG